MWMGRWREDREGRKAVEEGKGRGGKWVDGDKGIMSGGKGR